jgi:hypothetical protein
VTSALIASEPVQPLQPFLHPNLHQHGGRHLSAQCSRLTGPERCEITTALLLCRSAQRLQLTPRGNGKSGTASARKPISQANRLTRARAGRPENTFVTTVSCSCACRTASRCSADVAASGHSRKPVPICTPEAPRANAAAWCERTRKAAVVDPGGDLYGIQTFLKLEELQVARRALSGRKDFATHWSRPPTLAKSSDARYLRGWCGLHAMD